MKIGKSCISGLNRPAHQKGNPKTSPPTSIMRHLGQQGKVATTYFQVKSQYDTLRLFGVPLRNEIIILEQTTNNWSFFLASNLTHILYFICRKQLAAICHLTHLIPRSCTYQKKFCQRGPTLTFFFFFFIIIFLV